MGWGLFEAGWVRLRELEVEVPGLPPELDGLRVAHLSDFHFGVPSRAPARSSVPSTGRRERRPDLVAITGDLLTHPRGEPRLRALVERLPQPTFAVLGNHDLAIARDPHGRAVEPARAAARTPAEGRGRADRASRQAGVDRRHRSARRLSPHGRRWIRTRSRATPTSASCCPTSRASSTASSPGASTSCSRATCTTGRSRSRIRAARCGSRTRRRATRRASTARAPA